MPPFVSNLVSKVFGNYKSINSHEWQCIKPIKDIKDENTFIHRYVLLLTLLVIILFVQELHLRRMCPVVGLRIPNEHTPLLEARITRGAETSQIMTTLVVGCLIIVLASGALIGFYLLFIQHSNEVPPIAVPPFVARNVWQKGKVIQLNRASKIPGVISDCVVITQTDTSICHGYEECVEQIENMERNNTYLPYNYIISTEGVVYEYLGTTPSDYVPNRNSIVLAFIGNYTHTPPSRNQIVMAKRIIDELVKFDYLAQNYTIVGKDGNDLKHLSGNPANLSVELDKLMFVVLTRMFSNFTEAMEHM